MNGDKHHQKSLCYDFIIVGAGISGLIAAQELQSQKYSVRVIEKSKSVGGRMATRRDEQWRFDHGAQFVNLNFPELDSIDQILTRDGIIQPWIPKGSSWLKSAELGLNRIPKYFCQNLEISFLEKVARIETDLDFNHRVICESGYFHTAKNVILTCPLPQSLLLMKVSDQSYPTELNEIQYASAIVGLFSLHSKSNKILDISYLEKFENDIFSISNQTHKKVSPVLAFTITMSPKWSQKNFEKDDFELQDLLQEKLKKFMDMQGIEIHIAKTQIKKWKFSHPLQKYRDPFLILGERLNLFLIGDAFGGGSISGAMKSALALGQHVQSLKK